MRRALASVVVFLTLVGLLSPISVAGGQPASAEIAPAPEPSAIPPSSAAVGFSGLLDTSANVTEYPLISRAMMLPGGSTDALLADINRDGVDDLVVGVSGDVERCISIFYGLPDGSFASYPSYNISLDRNPIALAVMDRYLDGNLFIVALEERNSLYDTEYLEMLRFIANTSYEKNLSLSILNHPVDFVVGDFSGDAYPDVVLACTKSNPEVDPGSMLVIEGPLFQDSTSIDGGLGSNAIVSGDFNDDGLEDVVLANQYDGNLQLFLQNPGTGLGSGTVLEVYGNPVSLVAADLNTDTLLDVAVLTVDASQIHFFFQSSTGGLPSTELYNRSLGLEFDSIFSGDMNADGRDDLVLLSRSLSIASGFVQLAPEDGLWSSVPAFTFPTGAAPRSATIGQFDPDGLPDLLVSSAREDWSGSSLAVYLGGGGGFSNANATAWTNAYWDATLIAAGDLDGDDNQDLVLLYPSLYSFGWVSGFSGSTQSWGLGYSPTGLEVTDLNGDGRAEVVTSALGGSQVTISSLSVDVPDAFDSYAITLDGSLSDLCIADLNNDSLPDLAVVVDDARIELFLNTGSSEPFGPSPDLSIYLSSVPGMTVATGDFDSDGLIDIAYPMPGCKIGILLQADSDSGPLFGSSPDTVLFHTWSVDFAELWSGDLTGDGRTDIAARAYGGSEIRFFDQDDFTSTYASYDGLVLPEAPSFLSVMDATDDGRADVVVMFSSADLAFLYRQSSGAIPDVPSMTFVTGAYPTCAAIGDGTQDHRGDLLICDSGSHSVSMWEMYNFPPVADAGGPYTAYQGDPLVFDGSSLTGASEVPYMEYRWDFGDGTPVTEWARDPAPEHTYLELGTFVVLMDVRDPAGLMSNDSTNVEVVDSYPHTDFTWSPLNPHEGEPVTFTDTTYSYDPVVDLTWSVDGSVVSTGLEGTVTVAEFDDGMHTVELTATDSDGSVASESKTFSVLALAPELSIVAPEAVDEGQEVPISVTVDAWHDGPVDAISSVEWNFSYTGGPFVTDVSTGTVNSTTHVFSASGVSEVYTVAVMVTDVDGDSNISTFNIEVFDIGPTAGFSLSPSSPEEGLPFTFVDDTHTYDGITDWHWTLTYPDASVDDYYLSGAEMASVEFVLGDGSYSMSLEVSEADGDSDSCSLAFDVLETAPDISLSVSGGPAYREFENLSFVASVTSYDQVVSYEWDFVSLGPQFVSDRTTVTGETTYAYLWAGNYTAKVRVTDSDGSAGVSEVDLEIIDVPLSGSFGSDVVVTREDPEHTSVITFNASSMASQFPDISNTLWEFGDGARELVIGAPVTPVVHQYAPVSDYEANLTLTDDDGNVLVLRGTLYMVEPSIELVTPANNSVVRSGTPVRFIVGDDSLPLVSVEYSVDGGAFGAFETLYEISTDGWDDGPHSLEVRAEDKDGNIAVRRAVTVTIDDLAPVVTLTYAGSSVYGGDKVNITVQVDDPNVASGGVVLYVRYPGDDSVSPILMTPSGAGGYYALVEVPMRSGTLSYYITVEDLAGNTATTETYSVTVRLHLIDVLLPYLLVGAVLAAVGTAVYFARERKISVDETFVIYHDGRMLAHSTRRLKPGMDDQVLSGMFVAIQDFVKDSFKDETSFTLRKLDFGEKSVLVEKGSYVYLAVILHGKASKKVASRMKRVVDDIEERFSEHLVEWDGDLDKVRGVNDMVKMLYSKAPSVPQGLLGLRR